MKLKRIRAMLIENEWKCQRYVEEFLKEVCCFLEMGFATPASLTL
jgi:hypothetical protein